MAAAAETDELLLEEGKVLVFDLAASADNEGLVTVVVVVVVVVVLFDSDFLKKGDCSGFVVTGITLEEETIVVGDNCKDGFLAMGGGVALFSEGLDRLDEGKVDDEGSNGVRLVMTEEDSKDEL